MLMLASSSIAPRHRGSIERGVDGGNHRVIGGRAGEMCGDRLQEMIALSDRQRRRRALQQRELLIREGEGTATSAFSPHCLSSRIASLKRLLNARNHNFPLDAKFRPLDNGGASRVGLTPSPTCLPGQ